MAKKYHGKKMQDMHHMHHMHHMGKRHEESGMIHENHSAIANMPQEVMIKPYPMAGYYLPEDLDDTITGIDHQIDRDDSMRRAHMKPRKV